jgi:hypothetical protein
MKRIFLIAILIVVPSVAAILFLRPPEPQPEPAAVVLNNEPQSVDPGPPLSEPAPTPHEKLPELVVEYYAPSRSEKLATLNTIRNEALSVMQSRLGSLYPDKELSDPELVAIRERLQLMIRVRLVFLDPVDELLIDKHAYEALHHYLQAEALLDMNVYEWDRAQMLIAKAVKLHGRHPILLLKNASLAIRAGKMEIALWLLEKIDGGFPLMRLPTPKVYYERRATARAWIKNIPGAIADLTVAARMTEDPKERAELEQRIVPLGTLKKLQN